MASGVKVGELYGELRLDKGRFDRDIDNAGGRFSSFAGIAAKASLVAAGALVVVGGASTMLAAKFETNMANIHTLIGPGTESDARIKEMGESIKGMSVDTGKSLEDLAGGLYMITSAFGDTADSTKILEISAKASTAGLATTTESVNLLAAVTKGYGDTSAAAVQKASDLAFQTVKLGQTTFPELAASMGKAIPLANALGVSQEELFASMATLTGVTGNTAEVSTQLRGVYQALLNTNPKMVKALEDIGYANGETAVETLGLGGTLDALSESVDGDTKKLAEMFGSVEALNAVLALTGPQAEGFAEKTKAMGDAAGSTEEAFAIQQKTVAMSMARIGAAIQVVLVSLGEKFLPILQMVLDWVIAHMPEIGATFDAIMGTIGGAIDVLVNQILPPFIEAFRFIAEDVFAAFGTGADGMATGPMPLLQGAFGFLTETVLPAFAAAFSWISTNILPTAMEIFGVFTGVILPAFFRLFQAIQAWIVANWPMISKIIMQVADIVKVAFQAIAAVIKTVWPIVIAVAEVLFPAVGAAASVLLNVITAAFTAIGAVWNVAWAVAKVVTKGIGDAWSGLTGVIRTVWSGITGIVKAGANFLIGIVNGIIRAVNSIQVHIGRIGLDTPAGFVGVGPFDWNGLNIGSLPYLAAGTRNFVGGWAVAGENGPELINLPRGSDVFSNRESQAMMKGRRQDKPPIVNNFNLSVQGLMRARDPFEAANQMRRLNDLGQLDLGVEYD